MNIPEAARAGKRICYEFGGFRVDAGQRRLFDAASSVPVAIPPRVFDALLYMLENPGDLLTKAQLMQALWPHVVVEENSLNQVISVLRRSLGEKSAEHRFIVTAPGRGYRFVAAVRTSGPDAADDLDASDLSIGILPFVDLTAPKDGGYLGSAIAADLIRALSSRSRIRVAAHTSSFAFKSAPADVRSIARTLNVARILEGHVAQRGAQLVVSCRMVDGHSGLHVWSTELAKDARDLAALQSELVSAIHRVMDPDSPGPPGPTAAVDPEAYRLYLRALAHSMVPSPVSVDTSITLLRDAVARDPQFARARSLLAIQYTTCVMFGFPRERALELARHEVATALAMDDQNGETHCAAAVIDCLGGTWCRAEERFRVAHSLSADPLISGLRCAYLSLSVGHLQRAVQQAEHAVRVAPTHPIGVQMLASLQQMLAQDDESLRYAELAVELGASRTLAPLADILAQLALRAARHDEAVEYMQATLPSRLGSPAVTAMLHALCRTDGGGNETALATLLALETAMQPDELDPPMRKRLILWYAQLDALHAAYDLAFRSLDHFAREGIVGGAWGVLWLPEMAAFRAEERFALFARRLRLFEYWSEYGPPDGYTLIGDRLAI